MKPYFVFLAAILLVGCTHNSSPPIVAATYPLNGDMVHPSIDTIMVTFNKPMIDNTWSWVYETKDTFPEMTGDPYFDETSMICYLPVKLEPEKTYVVWINSDKFKNFKDKSGTSVVPYKLTFTTSIS